ncbi:putative Zinc finger protein [Naja naja]|nr:putative Zinc finger protein [Naja naja]
MEPWVYLDQRQKALYRDVMQESYETLMSLANQLLNNSNHEDEDEEDEEEPEGVEELRPGTSQSAPRKVKPLTRRETPKQPKIIPVEHKKTHLGCEDCGKVYRSRQTLMRHQRGHHRERTHLCEECGKGFVWASHLERHRRVHTGERPFPCPICGEKFAQKVHLLHHNKTHSHIRPYKSENLLQEKAIADVLRLWRLQCFYSSCNRTQCYEHGGREEHFRKCLGQWEAQQNSLGGGVWLSPAYERRSVKKTIITMFIGDEDPDLEIMSGVYEGPIEKVLTNSSLCYKKERNKDTQKFWIGERCELLFLQLLYFPQILPQIRVPDDYLEESILPFTLCGMLTEEMPTEDWKPGLGGRAELLQTCCDSAHPQHSLKHQIGGLIL